MDKIQKAIGYKFNDEQLLTQALHPTVSGHKNLSLKGDQLVRRLVTDLVNDAGHSDFIRQVVTSNDVLGSIFIAKQITQHIFWLDAQVTRDIEKVVAYYGKLAVSSVRIKQAFYIPCYKNPDDGHYEAVFVPKTLADMFEALANAVWLDCKENWDRWKAVFQPILWPIIDWCIKHDTRDPKGLVCERTNGAFVKEVTTREAARNDYFAYDKYGKCIGRGQSKELAIKAAAIHELDIEWPWLVALK